MKTKELQKTVGAYLVNSNCITTQRGLLDYIETLRKELDFLEVRAKQAEFETGAFFEQPENAHFTPEEKEHYHVIHLACKVDKDLEKIAISANCMTERNKENVAKIKSAFSILSIISKDITE